MAGRSYRAHFFLILLFLLLTRCGTEPSSVSKVALSFSYPVSSQTNSDKSIFPQSTVAPTNCTLSTLIATIHGPEMDPVHINLGQPGVSVTFDTTSSPATITSFAFNDITALKGEANVISGPDRKIEIAGILDFYSSDSTCSYQTTSGAQSFIVYGHFGPFELTGDLDINVPVYVMNKASRAENQTVQDANAVFSYSNFSSHRLAVAKFTGSLVAPCSAVVLNQSGDDPRFFPHDAAVYLIDITSGHPHKIRTYQDGSISTSDTFYAGPLFPGHRYRLHLHCSPSSYEIEFSVPEDQDSFSDPFRTVTVGNWSLAP